MDRNQCRQCRQISTSHKGNKESKVLARITTHQGTVSRSEKLVARQDKKNNRLLHGRRKKEKRDTPTYTDAERRQWRNERPTNFILLKFLGVEHFAVVRMNEAFLTFVCSHSYAVHCNVPEEPASKALDNVFQATAGTRSTFQCTTAVRTSSAIKHLWFSVRAPVTRVWAHEASSRTPFARFGLY